MRRIPTDIALAILLSFLNLAAVHFVYAVEQENGPKRSLPAAVDRKWSKLADAPPDLVGREMPPGMDGAWCYVPDLKGFLLYGGCSPRYTNEGWLFTPADRKWRLLWPDDSLGYNPAKKVWYVKLPRQIVWSTDRPGPAKGQAMVYDPVKRLVYVFGGFPDQRGTWFGDTKLGTWALDPRSLRFRFISSDGPRGMTRGVYDSSSRRIVAIPERPRRKGDAPVTWVFDPATEKWEARRCDPSPRPGPHPAFTFDERIKQCVYFSEYGETWTYDVRKNRWTKRAPSRVPPPRRHAGMCFHAKLGVSILHGGVHHLRNGGEPWARNSCEAFQVGRKERGVQYNDTWCYDAVNNEWKEVKTEGAPPPTASARDCFAYDSDRGACVLYDPSVGFWALGNVYPRSRPAGPEVVIDRRVMEMQRKLSSRQPVLNRDVRRWRERIKALPDDAWLDTELRKPTQGCLNFAYDPTSRCLFWLGGCNGAVFSTYEDYAYTNQLIILDMDAGIWFQRRVNHTWGPAGEGYRRFRPGNGCGRAFCYDSKRKAFWTLGGVTSIGFPGARTVQRYDVLTDRFSRSGPRVSGFGGANCGLVHDPKHDLLIGATGQYGDICATRIFDIKSGKWRRGEPHPPKFSLYTPIVYDPRVGVILITMLPKDWKPGDDVPKEPSDDFRGWVMRTFAYDVKRDVWKDLSPKNQDRVPVSDLPGIAYDSRNRVIVLVENRARDTGYFAPRKRRQVWILDLEKNAWRQGESTPPIQGINKCSLVYDRNHNVVILGERSRIYLYRYRGGCPDDAFASE